MQNISNLIGRITANVELASTLQMTIDWQKLTPKARAALIAMLAVREEFDERLYTMSLEHLEMVLDYSSAECENVAAELEAAGFVQRNFEAAAADENPDCGDIRLVIIPSKT